MKKKGITLLIVLLGLMNQAITQTAFPTQDANWCYRGYDDYGQNLGTLCIAPDGQVVIGGQTYTKIEYAPHPYDNVKELVYREQNGRFYVIPQDSINEILVYDFNLQVGDLFQTDWAWSLHDSIDLYVQSVDTVTTLDGVERKKITLTGGAYSSYWGTWLEGIGSLEWIFVFPAYNGTLSGGFSFICHSDSTAIIYPSWADSLDCGFLTNIEEREKQSKVELYPNPVNEKLHIDLNNSDAETLSIIDLTGRVMLERQITDNRFNLQLPNNMPTGIYYVQFTRKDESFFVRKLIKQ